MTTSDRAGRRDTENTDRSAEPTAAQADERPAPERRLDETQEAYDRRVQAEQQQRAEGGS